MRSYRNASQLSSVKNALPKHPRKSLYNGSKRVCEPVHEKTTKKEGKSMDKKLKKFAEFMAMDKDILPIETEKRIDDAFTISILKVEVSKGMRY